MTGGTTPDSFYTSAAAANAALGPISTTVSNLQFLIAPMAAGFIGGSSDSDPVGSLRLNPVSTKYRIRASPKGYEQTITTGTHLFNSLVETKSSADKFTMLSPPFINQLHHERAMADAREAADQAAEQHSSELAVLRALTATTPSEFVKLWAYAGTAIEPMLLNNLASEPVWGVSAPVQGKVDMFNCFGTNVRAGDEVGFIVKLEQPDFAEQANPHAPQPRNVLRIRGVASLGVPAHITTKTGVPAPRDMDSIRRGAVLKTAWRQTKYNPYAPAGQKYTTTVPAIAQQLGDMATSSLIVNMYEQGAYVRVGIVVDDVPKNPLPHDLLLAQTNIAAYNKLPRIGVRPNPLRR